MTGISIGTGFSSLMVTSVLAAAPLTVDDFFPFTHEFTEPTASSTVLNDAYNASDDHAYIIDFIIPDPETPPASNETIFYHGVGSNNYVWLRRRTSGSLDFDIRSGANGKVDFLFPEEMQYINKLMRIGVYFNSAGVMDVYINGRRWSTSTGKAEPLTNGSTVAHFNSPYSTDAGSSDGVRMRYYDTAKTRYEMEVLTDVSLKELGLSYEYDEDALGIVGAGQSNMSGGEVVANKTTMPEVANGNLNMINVNGDYEPFAESWYDPKLKSPIMKAFAQTFAGNGYAHLSGYMGRVGNDIAAQQNRNVVVTCAAASGTKISTDWAGARTDLNGQGTGATETVGYMTFGIFEAIRQMKAKCREVIVVHDQGQGDALEGMLQATYETQLNAQLDWIDYYHPEVFHYIVGFNLYNSDSTIPETDWDGINAARKAVAKSRPNCAFIDVEDVVVTNDDGLHYLNAEQETVGAYIAKTIYGGQSIVLDSPASGETTLDGSEPWNNKQEGYIIITAASSVETSNEYLVHLNDGGSSPGCGVRTLATYNSYGQLYRDDSGNVGAIRLSQEDFVDGRTQTYAYTWSNKRGELIQGLNGVFREDTFAKNGGTFASNTWDALRIGERNGGAEPYTGTIHRVEIGDTFLDLTLLKKKMNNPLMHHLMAGGQSISRQFFNSTDGSLDTGQAEILNQLRLALPNQEFLAFDGADGGSTVSPLSYEEYWWETLGGRGPELQDFHDVRIENGVKGPFVWWDLGVTDAHYIDLNENEVTFKNYKKDLLSILQEIRARDPETKFGIILQARRTSFGNTGMYQKVRDFYIELINTYDWIYRLPDIYDIDLFDAVHHTDTGIVTQATRIGRKIANIKGASLTGVDGPTISGASRSGTTVTVNITHDGGTDITPASAIQGFVFHDDEVAITINSAVRTDATTITLELDSAPTGVETLYYGYDALTDVTDLTKVVRDNSTPVMALQMTTVNL